MNIGSRWWFWSSTINKSLTTLEWNYSSPITAYGTAPYSSRNLTELTLGAWVLSNGSKKVATGNPQATPMFGWGSSGSWGGLNIAVNIIDGRVSYRSGTSSGNYDYNIGISALVGKWIHVAAIWTKTYVKYFYNGSQIYTVSRNMNFGTQNSTKFKCMRMDYTDSDGIAEAYVNSSIACIFAYQSALSNQQIASFAAEKKLITADPQMWFGYNVLNESSTTELQNVVKNGTPLSIVNGNDATVRWTVPLI